MQNVPPAEKKLLLWQMLGICVLVLLALVQMRRIIPESSHITELMPEANVTVAHDSRRNNATRAIKDGLKDPASYQEIDYREFFANSSDPKRYYQASIRFKAKDATGAYAIQRLCFHFTREGVVTETFLCDYR